MKDTTAPTPRLRAGVVCAAALWLGLAIALAVSRVPYDDEWFSITLARLTDDAVFWQSLRRDMHPPLVALVDRALLSLLRTDHWFPLQLLRIGASLFAMLLLLSVLRRQLKGTVPSLLLAVGAFHPIVLFYGGAVRWYPYLLLAQALRWWAIWSTDQVTSPDGRRRAVALCAGAGLGPAVGYVDLPLLAIDLAFFWRVHRPRGGLRLAVLAGFCGSAALLASVLALGNLSVRGLGTSQSALPNLLTWGGLGLVGEAHPDWPWLLASPLLALVPLWALGRRLWDRPSPSWTFATHIAFAFVMWAALAPLRVAHPRYSLLLWFILPALAAVLWRGKHTRWPYLAYIAYLLLGLVLTVGGQHFLKRDLNAMTRNDCETLLGRDPPKTVIVPYLRHATFLRQLCPRSGMALIAVPWIRHFSDERVQMTPVRSRLEQRKSSEVGLVLGVIQRGSLVITHRRLHRLLGEHCTLGLQRQAGDHRHHDLRQRFSRRRERPRMRPRYRFEHWHCRW